MHNYNGNMQTCWQFEGVIASLTYPGHVYEFLFWSLSNRLVLRHNKTLSPLEDPCTSEDVSVHALDTRIPLPTIAGDTGNRSIYEAINPWIN